MKTKVGGCLFLMAVMCADSENLMIPALMLLVGMALITIGRREEKE